MFIRPGRLVARVTIFCAVATNVVSIIVADSIPRISTNVSFYMHRAERDITVRFRGHSRSVGRE